MSRRSIAEKTLLIVFCLVLTLFVVKGQNTTTGNQTTTNSTTNTTTNTTSNTTNTTTNSTTNTTTNSTTNTTTNTSTTPTTTTSAQAQQYNFTGFQAISSVMVLTLNSYYTGTAKQGQIAYLYLDYKTVSTVGPVYIGFFSQTTGFANIAPVSVNVWFQKRASSYADYQVTPEAQSNNFLSFAGTPVDGTFLITVDNTQGNTDYKFVIKGGQSANLLRFIPPYASVQYMFSLAQNSSHNYAFEVQINATTNVFYSAQGCVGSVALYYTSDSTQLASIFLGTAAGALSFEQPGGYGFKQFSTGTYYFVVSVNDFVSLNSDTQAAFTFSLIPYANSETVPQLAFQPGKQGAVWYTTNTDGTAVTLQWNSLQQLPSGGSLASGTSTSYQVYVSAASERAGSMTRCNATLVTSGPATSDQTISVSSVSGQQAYSQSVGNLANSQGYYIGLKAVVSSYSSSGIGAPQVQIPYSVFFYQVPAAGSTSSSKAVVLAVFVYRVLQAIKANGGGSSSPVTGGSTGSKGTGQNRASKYQA